MKKITLVMFAFVASFAFAQNATNAELVLSQTSGAIGDGGVACGDSGAGTTGDNYYMRGYYLGDYGVTGIVQLTGLEFFVSTESGSTSIDVMVFDYEGAPSGLDVTMLPAPLASGTMTIDAGMVGTMQRIMFTTPAIADDSMNIVAVVFESDGQTSQFYLGTAEQETDTSYLGSVACGINNPVPVEAIGFPDSKHVINIVAETELSAGQNVAEMVSVFPNPTTGILNLKTPSNVDVTSVSLFDLLGKKVSSDYSNGVINMSSLSQGVYLLKAETSAGTLTQKIVKQ